MSTCAWALSAAAVAISSPAQAQAASFNIPAQPLANALEAFGKQSGKEILFDWTQVAGKTSSPLSGSMPPGEALTRLIAGTGMVVRQANASTFVVSLGPQVGSASPASEAAATESRVALEEIVVTAEKRTTNLQKTPIAISVMSNKDLERRHVQSLLDLADGAIPSLRVSAATLRTSALLINIRGVGATIDPNQPARDQATGVYINGVYLGRAQGLGAGLFDIERVEVLKGPQGTLFGRNTEGGAVSIVTKRPTGRFAMDTVLGLSNYDGYEAQTHIDLPSFHDVSIKFDGVLAKRDGTVKNPNTYGQSDFNSYDRHGISLEALWRPTDTFSAGYAFEDSYNATTPIYQQLLTEGPARRAPLQRLQPDRADEANFGVPLLPNVGKTSGHRLNVDWTLGSGLELKSISSYRTLSQSQFDSGLQNFTVFAPNSLFNRYSVAGTWQKQYSTELQLVGTLPQVNFVLGALYYHEYVRDNAQTISTLQFNATGTAYATLPFDLNTVPYDRASHVTTESYGVFGQATWTPPILDGRSHLTLGGRLTRDAKRGSLDIVNGALPSYVNPQRVTVVGIIPLDAAWSRFDPLVTLAVDLTPGVNVYGKWSTGYKSGGANSRSLTFRSFDPEVLSMYELGAKSEFWDHRARLNLAAFTGDLKNVQVDFSVSVLNNNRATIETTNAATGRTRGLEADFTVQPVEGLTVSASYAYTEVMLAPALNPFTNALSTITVPYTARNAASLSVDYERPAFGATLRAHLDGNYSDSQYTNASDPTLSDSSLIVNGRLALAGVRLRDDSELELAVWARNLLNEAHLYTRRLLTPQLGYFGAYNDPRTFGLQIRFKY